MGEADASAVRRIYQEGLDTGEASFESLAPTGEEWCEGHLAVARLVAVSDGEVLGWAALSSVSDRCVYGGVAEVSVYVGESARGQGVGSLLMSALVEESERAGIWSLSAGLFPENEASLKLHEKHGFRVIGLRKRIGQQNGLWRDTLLLERRSEVVGV